MPPVGGGDWFMVHEYRDVLAATADVVPPKLSALGDSYSAQTAPSAPVIAAFTPHLDGQFGVTIGEFTVDLSQGDSKRGGARR